MKTVGRPIYLKNTVKKGRPLVQKIKADGYDGIVTVDGRFVSEIVKL